MLLGIMSDSHDNLSNVEKALNTFHQHGIELLIHLGDVISPFSLRKIVQVSARVIVIRGNNDGDALQLREIANKAGALFKEPPYEITIDNKVFLLLHGSGSKSYTKKIAHSFAKSGNYDVVMYGHTHEVEVSRINNCLLINPGEVFGMLSGKSTIAILDTKTMDIKIIEL